jgi:hypothetical protein
MDRVARPPARSVGGDADRLDHGGIAMRAEIDAATPDSDYRLRVARRVGDNIADAERFDRPSPPRAS